MFVRLNFVKVQGPAREKKPDMCYVLYWCFGPNSEATELEFSVVHRLPHTQTSKAKFEHGSCTCTLCSTSDA